MKKIILSVSVLAFAGLFAQENQEKPNGWTRGGSVSLLFNQAAFNKDWTGGGSNNYGGNFMLSYDANYKKDAWTWDNKFLMDYGFNRVDGDEFAKKTNDRISLTSVVGRQATEQWFYSFFLNFQTQIAKGYKYFKNTAGIQDRAEYTDFMSPGYLSFGPGMLWKKSDNLKVNLAPATSRFIFAKERFTKNLANDAEYFGVEANKTMKYELGFAVNAYAKFDLMQNVSMENTLNLYSNYLDKPQNVDIDYTMNLVMKVNDFLSANLIFQAIYDDNAVGAFQIREAFGAGLTYKF